MRNTQYYANTHCTATMITNLRQTHTMVHSYWVVYTPVPEWVSRGMRQPGFKLAAEILFSERQYKTGFLSAYSIHIAYGLL